MIPNEMLLSAPVQNYSLTDRTLRLTTQVTVSYQSDVERVLHLLQEAAASVERVSKNPPPQALLLKFGADGLELEIGFWIADPENGRSNVLSDVNRAIWKILQTCQIEIPFPPRDIRLIDVRDKGQNGLSEVMHVTNAR